MQEEPAQQYAEYYRDKNSQYFGSSRKLRALADGYFGLNYVFIVNVAIAIAVLIGASTLGDSAVTAEFVAAGVLAAIVGVMSYPFNKKIGYAVGWKSSEPLIVSMLMALSSWICGGIIGYAIIQNIAAKEMKLFGVKSNLIGLRKEIETAIRELERKEEARQGAGAVL
ncbi:MAG TPA: hypothetical protein VGL56_04840 [Fimbriimonadaceae bacterium]|jgi:hypothetical protein